MDDGIYIEINATDRGLYEYQVFFRFAFRANWTRLVVTLDGLTTRSVLDTGDVFGSGATSILFFNTDLLLLLFTCLRFSRGERLDSGCLLLSLF